MWEKFGEFDSAEELNRAALAQREEGDEVALKELAKENGIDEEDAEDFMDGVYDNLVTPLSAAVGKIQVESESLGLKGILGDWKDLIIGMCTDIPEMAVAVRRKGKDIAQCMAVLIAWAFANKVQVPDKIVSITKIKVNGKEETMRNPLYLGIPSRQQAREIIRQYYLGEDHK